MKRDDIIEGPIDIERPGTFLSNLVITEKKGTEDKSDSKTVRT